MQAVVAASRGALVEVEGLRGIVHAAFPRAVYVTPTSGPMMIVHDVAFGSTPTSVRVDPHALSSVRRGDLVAGRAGHLRVGDVVVDLRHVPVWTAPAAP